MNFNEKLMKDLRDGHSYDAIMEEFTKHLNEAHEAYEAELRAEQTKAKRANEVSNRLVSGTLTEDDVNWVINCYMKQPGGHKNFTLHLTSAVDDMLDAVFNSMSKRAHECECKNKSKSDEEVLRDFVQKIM